MASTRPHVRHGDPYALSYTPTGQECPAFRFDTTVLERSSCVLLGDKPWQVHGAPYFGMLRTRHFANQAEAEWIIQLTDARVRSGAAKRQGDVLHTV